LIPAPKPFCKTYGGFSRQNRPDLAPSVRDDIDLFVPDRAFAEELEREREIMMKIVMHSPFTEDDRRVDTIIQTYLGEDRGKSA
jgi:hypothetical protein